MGGKSGKVTVNADQGTAAATALSLSVIDPTFTLARQEAELNLVADLISRGATVTLDRKKWNIGGLGPQPDRGYLDPKWLAGMKPLPDSFAFSRNGARHAPVNEPSNCAGPSPAASTRSRPARASSARPCSDDSLA